MSLHRRKVQSQRLHIAKALLNSIWFLRCVMSAALFYVCFWLTATQSECKIWLMFLHCLFHKLCLLWVSSGVWGNYHQITSYVTSYIVVNRLQHRHQHTIGKLLFRTPGILCKLSVCQHFYLYTFNYNGIIDTALRIWLCHKYYGYPSVYHFLLESRDE